MAGWGNGGLCYGQARQIRILDTERVDDSNKMIDNNVLYTTTSAELKLLRLRLTFRKPGR